MSLFSTLRRRSHLHVLVLAMSLLPRMSATLASQSTDASANVQSSVRGKQLLTRAQEALGGVESLAALKDVTHMMDIALEPSAGGYKLRQVSQYVAAPGLIRHEQETPFGKITVYSDGESGWLSTPQGVEEMTPPILRQTRGVIFRQMTTLLLSDRDHARSVNAVGENAIRISSTDGQSVLIEFDPMTGFPLRQIYTEQGANGESVERVEEFSDWRETSGFTMPYREVQRENGVKMLEITISAYKFNAGITVADLNKRPTN